MMSILINNIHNSNDNILINSHHTLNIEQHKAAMRDTAISTELECFISKPSSDSLSVDEDENNSPFSSNDEFESTPNDEVTCKKKRKRHRSHCQFQPQWLLYLSSIDKMCSSKIHKLSCGSMDYLFVFGAVVFGSKFMPITILLSIFLVDIPGFIYLLLSCTSTVAFTQFSKRMFGRKRPDPKTLAPKKLDFRTRLTNYSFPSGDTAQAAAYSMSLYLLTQNIWLLILIPNCAWSRVYFGCHWICDCIIGA